jgi:hypothetical protein
MSEWEQHCKEVTDEVMKCLRYNGINLEPSDGHILLRAEQKVNFQLLEKLILDIFKNQRTLDI